MSLPRNRAHGDFSLLEDSPAPKLGFKPIVGAGD